jgi:diguanylate cyclase
MNTMQWQGSIGPAVLHHCTDTSMSANSAPAPSITALSGEGRQEHPPATANGDPAYSRTVELSQASLEAARKYGNAPTPTVYDVWYNYASGENREMIDRINRLISAGRTIDEYLLGQLHDQYLDKSREHSELSEATAQFDQQVSRIHATIDTHSDACREFSETLEVTNENLSNVKSAQGIREAVSSLISKSKAMDERTRDIHRMLDESQKEIEYLQRALEASQQRELLDPLTNILNRRGFERELIAELHDCEARATPLSLMIVDIDHFKNINDTYGHLIGDEVLKFVGKLLQSHVRPDDVVARYGGEEFAVVLKNCEVGSAAVRAEKFRRALAATTLKVTRSNSILRQITASIGLSQYRKNDDINDLIERSDREMYRSKAGGRNRVSF